MKDDSNTEFNSLSDMIPKAEKYWTECESKWETEFPTLDMSVVFQPSSIVILGAEPKYGKTTFSLQIARSFCEQGVSILFWDFENGFLTILFRIVSQIARVNFTDLILGVDEVINSKVVLDAFQEIEKKYKTFCIARPQGIVSIVDGYKEINLNAITEHLDAFEEHVQTKHHALFIDSLSKLPAISDSPTVTTTQWMLLLEDLKHDRKYFIWAVSQLSRAFYDKKCDSVNALANSSAIEYGASIVLMLGRPKQNSTKLTGLWLLADRIAGGYGHIVDMEFESNCYFEDPEF